MGNFNCCHSEDFFCLGLKPSAKIYICSQCNNITNKLYSKVCKPCYTFNQEYNISYNIIE